MKVLANDMLHLYEARANILKAIAHPSRLFIIEELDRGRRCVQELTDMIGADISTVSKHLSVLKNAGLVMDEKEGTTVYYSLRVPCLIPFLGCLNEVLVLQADEQQKVLNCCTTRLR